jgi:hypothetical protein
MFSLVYSCSNPLLISSGVELPCQLGQESFNDTCQDCWNGYFDINSQSCQACSDGKYAEYGKTICTDCSRNRYSNLDANTCEWCPLGSYAPTQSPIIYFCVSMRYGDQLQAFWNAAADNGRVYFLVESDDGFDYYTAQNTCFEMLGPSQYNYSLSRSDYITYLAEFELSSVPDVVMELVTDETYIGARKDPYSKKFQWVFASQNELLIDYFWEDGSSPSNQTTNCAALKPNGKLVAKNCMAEKMRYALCNAPVEYLPDYFTCSAGKSTFYGIRNGLNNTFGCSCKSGNGVFNDSCIQCTAGTDKHTRVGSTCTNCTVGFFSNTAGADLCSACPINTIQTQCGQTFCDQCGVGYVTNSTGSTECMTCLPGQKIRDYTTCEDCDPGKYLDDFNSTNCIVCPIGKYSSSYRSTRCDICSPGTYSPSENSLSCTLCPPGRYTSLNASKDCTECPQGRFSTSYGSSFCTECIAHATNAFSFRNVSDCVCIQGYFGTVTGNAEDQCQQCLETPFITCPVNSSIPMFSPGYFWRKDNPGELLSCIPPEACLANKDDSGTICASGYTGLRCGDCIVLVSFRQSGGCKPCPNRAAMVFTIIAVLVVFVFLVFRFSSGLKSIPVDVRIVFQAIQIIGLYPGYLTKWPQHLASMFNILSFTVSFSLSFLSVSALHRTSTLNCSLPSVPQK